MSVPAFAAAVTDVSNDKLSFSPSQVTPAIDTSSSNARTRPPVRKRSRCGAGGGGGGGGGSTPALVEGDTLCPAASSPTRHTPSAKGTSSVIRDNVIREMEVTPHSGGESGEDQEMADVRDKGGGEVDGKRCLPGSGGAGVVVTPLERTPQMPDPASMRKCLDAYMEVRAPSVVLYIVLWYYGIVYSITRFSFGKWLA